MTPRASVVRWSKYGWCAGSGSGVAGGPSTSAAAASAAMPTSFHTPQSRATTWSAPVGLAGLGEGVEEGVGGDVVDLAERGGDRAGRREHDEQVEVVGGRRLLEHEGAVHLGGEHVLHVGRGLGDDQLVVDHAGGVDDAVDRAEALADLGDGGADLLDVGDVALDQQHLGAGGLERSRTPAMRRAVGWSGPRRSSQLVPLVAVGQGAAGQQGQAGPAVGDQLLGDGEGDAAEAAGDEHDAALAQAGRSWSATPARRTSWTKRRSPRSATTSSAAGGASSSASTIVAAGARPARAVVVATPSDERRSDERTAPTTSATSSRRCGAALREQLGLVDVEGRRGDVGQLPADQPAPARARWTAPATAPGRGRRLLRRPWSPRPMCSGRCTPGAGPRLGEEHQALEAELLVAVEEAAAGPVLAVVGGQQGEVGDAIGNPAGADQVAEQRLVVDQAVLGRDHVLVVGDGPVGVAGPDDHDVVAAGAQALDDVVADAGAVDQHEPADGLADRRRRRRGCARPAPSTSASSSGSRSTKVPPPLRSRGRRRRPGSMKKGWVWKA